ncbi:metal ABC transporter solute-binding protein, Zn/Mn family [Streptomyces sp. XD-27]|uniref:metal ABC transporter solute-binding protein, Zn/Mn family n=1 Tax=Streptomyces sp. XD-27 TaxID=3062779 RepID=UPI0026F47005|nr:zinc ABC transporter substrate-binding protein [Streptomyces sp. XD-27]WKX69028.1 zinc ABC transporter substrate-binding protein [Streptomyces sp. XD-27]
MRALPSRTADRRTTLLALASATALVVIGAACTGSSSDSGDASSRMRVVAAENFWGSIAEQLGGSRVEVTSVIDNPDADPHDYEPTAADARTVADAKYVIVNGVGYDAWAPKLLAANPVEGRTVLTVGDLVGVKAGGNPHLWYSPEYVHRVVDRVTADYKKLDPDDAAYFDKRKQTFEDRTLARYNELISEIRKTYGGTPIGASESIVPPLAEGLGLKVLTPESFLDAISEGADPTAHDKAAVDRQIENRQIKVFIYNSQNSTPDVQAQVKAAKAAGIPVATVTETPVPADASFQDWQASQLQDIARALAEGTGSGR